MQLGQLLHQRQTDARSLVGASSGARHAMKTIENPRQLAAGNPNPAVLDRQNGPAIHGAQAHRDDALKRELEGVGDEIENDFLHMSRSTQTGSASGGQSTTSRSPVFSITARNSPTRPSVKVARSTGSYEVWTRPASIREKSSSVLTSRMSRSPLRCATTRSSRLCGKASAGDASACSSGPNINVRGVRNSWLTFEKNAVFARSISASASARLRSSS